MSSPARPRLLLLSEVDPRGRAAGQSLRVANLAAALKKAFHVILATPRQTGAENTWEPYCDDLVLLDPPYRQPGLARRFHQSAALAYQAATGLKRSNYYIAKLLFPPHVVAALAAQHRADAAVFEYWHAHAAAAALRQLGTPCVLDMHDILWRAFAEQQRRNSRLPAWLRARQVERYRRAEETAWLDFDSLLAINDDEARYVRSRLPAGARVLLSPMGIDLSRWPYLWAPHPTPRVGFYGGLGSPQNQEAAWRCVRHIMPLVWRRHPLAELWLIGSAPPPDLLQLARQDPRIHVTGFLADVGPTLASLRALWCPWRGQFGFRSRIIEAMATGVPTLVNADAVAGMQLSDGAGITLAETDQDFATRTCELLDDDSLARRCSERGRLEAGTRFSLPATYGKVVDELQAWLGNRRSTTP